MFNPTSNKTADTRESKRGLFPALTAISYIPTCRGSAVLPSIVNVKLEPNVGARKLGLVDPLCDPPYPLP
jgi:hypothetical protein